MTSTRRLIEDYLPIETISAESSREKRQISGLHLWWARRPLVACRAAIYGCLMPSPEFSSKSGASTIDRTADRKKTADFVARLCSNAASDATIAEAQRNIRQVFSDRGDDRPRVLDMFTGGGAIPLEALRLGCDAYALDLNPVAHIIQLCTLVYPQAYFAKDASSFGCADGGQWDGLISETRLWAERVITRVAESISAYHPEIPDPKRLDSEQGVFGDAGERGEPRRLRPVAYLWTRTVRCKNPACGATIPLVRQTWLVKKEGRYAALRTETCAANSVRFRVVESQTAAGLGFDPSAGSKGGSAVCPYCQTVADDDYVRGQGMARKVGRQPMAIVCLRPGEREKVYVSADDVPDAFTPDDVLRRQIDDMCSAHSISVPDEPINPVRPSPWTRGASGVTRHGLTTWGDLFTPRQTLGLVRLAIEIRDTYGRMVAQGYAPDRARAVVTYMALVFDKVCDYNSSLCSWHYNNQQITHTYGRQALPMVWDFTEVNFISSGSGSWSSMLDSTLGVLPICASVGTRPAHVQRGSALQLPWPDGTFDAVVTDPPYYDNIPYADIADFFYVWLKRILGPLYPEHFSSALTPKREEATALSSRHGGDMAAATAEYEDRMLRAFSEASRVLKADGCMTVVYAHKTTLGWATIVNALRRGGLMVTEAWPLETEMKSRFLAVDTSALASSIFIVARKRMGSEVGLYESDVQPNLSAIVRERVTTLWNLGVSGADLVIACVGAGLRAFTQYHRVEYANGEDVPAERFLSEVEGVVLEEIFARLSQAVGSENAYNLAGLDSATRFYLLWRYTYGAGDLDAGEAIIFANGTHVELDGADGLSGGSCPLLIKKKGTYHLRDFSERGGFDKLGVPGERESVPLVDALQRVLWLMENRPSEIPSFIRDGRPNIEQMRLVAQALSGPALKGGGLTNTAQSSEVAALAKLTANWRTVVEDSSFSMEDKLTGQQALPLGSEG